MHISSSTLMAKLLIIFFSLAIIPAISFSRESGDGVHDIYQFSYDQTTPFLDKLEETGYKRWPTGRLEIDKKLAKEYPFIVRTRIPHQVVILDHGQAELEVRIQMIIKAKKTINYEMFLMEQDESTKIVLGHLMQKSREGIKVRLLIDHIPLYIYFDESYLAVLKENGIEVKLYNKSSVLDMLGRGNYRDHRKFISIDDKYALVTGRNQADSYFNMSDSLNYYDRGILIMGPIVPTLNEQFDAFFNHPYSSTFETDTKNIDAYLKWTKQAREYFYQIDSFDLATRELIRRNAEKELSKTPQGVCPNMLVVSDLPGRGMRNKRVHREIFNKIGQAKTNVLIESPSVILTREERDIFWDLLKRDVKIAINTNTYMHPLEDVPSMMDINLSNDHMSYWHRKGVQLFTPTGNETTDEPFVNYNDSKNVPGWNLHTKSIMIDHKDFMIGSYNVDPRSKEFSSEMVIFCEGDRTLTDKVEDLFYQRAKAGVEFNKNHRPPGGFLKDTTNEIKLWYNLQKPFIHLFHRLL